MKKLSIDEFKDICDNISPKVFIIASDNQDFDSVEYGVRYKLNSPKMVIATNPSAISFTNHDNSSYIKFSRIKYISECKKSLLGNVFRIVCTGFFDKEKEFSYTIIAR